MIFGLLPIALSQNSDNKHWLIQNIKQNGAVIEVDYLEVTNYNKYFTAALIKQKPIQLKTSPIKYNIKIEMPNQSKADSVVLIFKNKKYELLSFNAELKALFLYNIEKNKFRTYEFKTK